jgi:hypothetical protein
MIEDFQDRATISQWDAPKSIDTRCDQKQTKNVSWILDNESIVFRIINTPGPGTYNNNDLATSSASQSHYLQRVPAPVIKPQFYTGTERKLGRIPIHKKPGPGAYETNSINLYDSILSQNKRLGAPATIS